MHKGQVYYSQLFIKLRDAKIHPSIPTPLVGNLACMRMKTHWSIIGPCYEMLPCTAVRFSVLKCTALMECSIIGGWLQEMDRSHQCLGTSNPCTCPRNYILRCWEVDAKLNQFMRKRKWNSRIEKQKKEVWSMKRWKGGSTQEGECQSAAYDLHHKGAEISLYIASQMILPKRSTCCHSNISFSSNIPFLCGRFGEDCSSL